MNKQQIAQWAAQSFQRMIIVCTEGNPVAIYNYMKAVWPKEVRIIDANYVTGTMNRTYYRNFLIEKATRSGNPAAFAKTLLQAIPMPENTKPITDYIRLNPTV